MRSTVLEVRRDELRWGFDANPPHVYVQQPTGWGTYTSVDPCPAYGHDATLVRRILALCEEAFPPLADLSVSLLPYEVLGRTNGQSDRCHVGEDGCRPGVIVLSGKRIPIHPAMTRYLVAHEYGHHVQWWLEHRRGMKTEESLRTEYAQLRGMDPALPYGPGTWHASVGEVFANDFRVLVARVETEFWPHPGVPYPVGNAAVEAWWAQALAP